MTINETIEYLIEQQTCLLWEIREQSNLETPNSLLDEDLEFSKGMINNLNLIKSELERLRRYDEEISKEMPEDFKDFYQNSKEEWPLITRLTLEGRRKEIEWCYDVIEKLTKKNDELEEECLHMAWDIAEKEL